MSIEIKSPTFPESVADGTIAKWLKKEGDHVNQDEVIVEIETDKVVLEVLAQSDGVVSKIIKPEGEIVASSELIGEFEESDGSSITQKVQQEEKSKPIKELSGKRELDILVIGELPSGEMVSSKVKFNIKPLPTPFGSIDGANPEVLTKANFKGARITAGFGESFNFELSLRVQSFKLTVEGIGSFDCTGNELSAAAKRAIDRAGRNSLVRISDINGADEPA